MKSKHTPGPWESYDNMRVSFHYLIRGGNGRIVAQVHKGRDVSIIEAAPDMLEALNEMVISFDILDIETDSLQREAIRNAKKAIKKATGDE